MSDCVKEQKRLMALIYAKKVASITAKEFEEFRRELSRGVLAR